MNEPAILGSAEFTEQCRRIVSHYGGERAHYELDQLVARLLGSLGYSEGAAIFKEQHIPAWIEHERALAGLPRLSASAGHYSTTLHGPDGQPEKVSLRVLTGATATLCAAHRSRDGDLHGHTWEIKAWWAEGPDAVERKAALNEWIAACLDHGVLGDDIAWGEALARAILMGLQCERVEVSRPLEGLFAMAERL